MPEGDKSTQQGAPAPGPAPAGGSTGGSPAPPGLAPSGGGQQAPAQAGPAVAPQQGPTGTQAPATGGWTQADRNAHIQTLYQKVVAEKKELEAKLQAAEAARQPQAEPTAAAARQPISAIETEIEDMWMQTGRDAHDTMLARVRERFGETYALRWAAQRGIIPQQPQVQQPVQAAPQQIDPDAMRQIVRQELDAAHAEGETFGERLAAYAAPYGGDAFLAEQITVTTPQGVLTMARRKAVDMYRRFTGVADPRAILNDVDGAGMEAARDRVAEQRVWEHIRAMQASGQVVVGPAGAPVAPTPGPGMATPTAALSDSLTQVAVASTRYGSVTKPSFADGK